MEKVTAKRCLILGVLLCALLGLVFSTGLSRTSDLEKQARAYYQPESWPKPALTLWPGLRLDDFRLEGFQLKERRYFAPAKGTNYIWRNEKEQLELWIIVNVRTTVESAQRDLFNWLVSGTAALMKKGTLTGQEARIGDISWADPQYGTLAFVRRNVAVIILGRTNKTAHRQLIDRVASTIDNVLREGPGGEGIKRDIKMIAPAIESVTLSKSKLRVNERTKVTVVARDPCGGKLEYAYRATGGNILRTKDGVFYQATMPGDQTITVLVVNPDNITAEKEISVTVTK